MDTLSITGKLVSITEKKQRGGYAFIEFVLETRKQYTHNNEDREDIQTPKFTVSGRLLEAIETYRNEIGCTIKVDFELQGRKWEKDGVIVDYFNTLKAFKLTQLSPAETPSESASEHSGTKTTKATPKPSEKATPQQSDDLPF